MVKIATFAKPENVSGNSKKTTVKLFNFIKRQPKTDFSPEQTIRRLVDYMPDFYRTQRQFINCVAFFDNREWELALDSLIELADETEHYFSEDFWLGLADSADKMDLTDKADYCRKQIKRNEKDIKSKTPFGWTTIKFDDKHFQHHISEKLKEEWATERRKKDKVQELLTKDGVHLKSHGRSGYIYFVDKKRIAEIDFELGVNALILFFSRTNSWALPTKQTLTEDEKQNIKNKILKTKLLAGQQLHKMQSNLTTERRAATNRRLAKKRVQWLIEALCFVSSSLLADCLVLRNPPERQARNRYALMFRDITNLKVAATN